MQTPAQSARSVVTLRVWQSLGQKILAGIFISRYTFLFDSLSLLLLLVNHIQRSSIFFIFAITKQTTIKRNDNVESEAFAG